MDFSIAMLYVFILLQVMDALSTVYGMRLGHTEKNPLLAWLFEKVGVIPALLVVKTGMVAVLVYYVGLYPVWILVAGNILYAYIFYKNLEVIGEGE
jgi:hypothetical protein